MRKKMERTLDNIGTLEARYNKALVCSQLKGLFAYESDEQMYRDANSIMLAWEKSHAEKDKRARFFNVREVLKLDYDLVVLVSGYGKWMVDSYDYDILMITHARQHIKFGVPVNKAVLKYVGDVDIIARIIIAGGIRKLCSLIGEAGKKADNYELRDKLTHNMKILMDIENALYDERIF